MSHLRRGVKVVGEKLVACVQGAQGRPACGLAICGREARVWTGQATDSCG